MNNHRYVGLAGTIDDRHRPSHGRHGVVESCDGNGVMLLLDSGRHEWVGLPCFVPDNPPEARRRLTEPAPEWTGPDRWQYAYTRAGSPAYGEEPHDPAPDSYVAIGAWEPFAANSEALDWRRPLRRVQG